MCTLSKTCVRRGLSMYTCPFLAYVLKSKLWTFVQCAHVYTVRVSTIISIGNPKGGVGKTTSAINLAQNLGRKHSTLLLDADAENKNALYWRNGDFNGWTFDVLDNEIATAQQAKKYQILMYDTKGNEDGSDLITLARNSAILIIPSKTDGPSLDTLTRIVHELTQAQVRNFRVLIAANIGSRGEFLREEMDEAGIPVFNTIIRHSVSVIDVSNEQIPLEASKNKYAKLVATDYASLSREVMSYV